MQVEISDIFMEMLLNLICFTDFYFMEIFDRLLFIFFSTLISPPNFYLKLFNF